MEGNFLATCSQRSTCNSRYQNLLFKTEKTKTNICKSDFHFRNILPYSLPILFYKKKESQHGKSDRQKNINVETDGRTEKRDR